MKKYLKYDREWLETDGLGGYASSTEGDCPSRKYHGLFVTPLPGLEGRFMLLSDALLSIEGEDGYSLGSSFYPGAIHPSGYLYLESFTTHPMPTWTYFNGVIKIKKEIFMVRGERAVYVAWTIEEINNPNIQKVKAHLKLLFNFRSSHGLSSENGDIKGGLNPLNQGYNIEPYDGLPPLSIQFTQSPHISENLYWDKSVEYPWEKRRGFDFREDRFVPGDDSFELERGRPLVMRVSLEPIHDKVSQILLENHKKERENRPSERTPWERLAHKSMDFLVTNSQGQLSVVAGYPWFGEWGRDTMIALPGLLFGQYLSLGARVLCDYAGYIEKGLLPNTLGEMQGFTSHNSLDASLLYLRAVDLLLQEGYGKRAEEKIIIKETLYPAVREIVEAFLDNVVPNSFLTKEGLLSAGSENTQLTWMDAMVEGVPVTPRHGFAVDLNALWYGGLLLYKKLCGQHKKFVPLKIRRIIRQFPCHFTKTFYLEERGFLSDTVLEGRADRKLRPNMLFATAIGLLGKEEGKRAVKRAKDELLTPLGVRTLSPHDPEFAPVYEGSGPERDRVYHQGTVWPWPLGIMVESALKYADDLKSEKAFWRAYLNKLLEIHLNHQGIDTLSEVFDGLEPLEGKGCFAQAWSVGEVLRAWRLVNEKES